MATLEKIRTRGPLLVIVIGLALFAFIAGDAGKILQPHQSQKVGEVDGEELTAQDYQALVEEYSAVIKFSSGSNALTDEQNEQIKDEVWRTYVNNKLLEKETEKLGLTVSKEEVQAIIDAGVHPLLQQSPFRNQQTGAFDKDLLKNFLVEYTKMNRETMQPQQVEYFESMYKFWSFLQKTLIENRLAEKYQALVSKALFSNPTEAKAAFEARVNQSDLLLAAIPYASVPDSTVSIKQSELKELYNKKKEQFKQYVETRNIKYIDVQVTASAEDRAEIEKEMSEYVAQLTEKPADYANFIRSTGSDHPYVDLYCTKDAFPADVAARIDSAALGTVSGPYYNAADNTINAFSVLAKTTAADSIEFRQIQVLAADAAKTKQLADSILTAIKAGADFAELAKKQGQTGQPNWISSANYENGPLEGENLKFIATLTSASVNEISTITIGEVNVILQVLNKKGSKDKYKVAVVKRPVEFSKDTYNKAYNNFSQFIASNPTLDKLKANAEEAGYKLLERNDLSGADHTIGDVRGTKEALRWAFAAKKGEVSGLYECGESDRLMVVGLADIIEEGYRPLDLVQDQLRAELVKEKKAEKIIASMKALNATSITQYQAMNSAVSDSLKYVTFAAPAYVAALRSSEPLVGAYASVAEVNKLSAPIQGNAGVFVLQMYAKERLNETFDAKAEEATKQTMYARFAGRLMNDLYLKASVKDTRYLFF